MERANERKDSGVGCGSEIESILMPMNSDGPRVCAVSQSLIFTMELFLCVVMSRMERMLVPASARGTYSSLEFDHLDSSPWCTNSSVCNCINSSFCNLIHSVLADSVARDCDDKSSGEEVATSANFSANRCIIREERKGGRSSFGSCRVIVQFFQAFVLRGFPRQKQ